MPEDTNLSKAGIYVAITTAPFAIFASVVGILAYFGIKHEDLAMIVNFSFSHVLLLIVSILLLAYGLAAPAWVGVVQKRVISKLRKELAEKSESLKESARRNLEYRDQLNKLGPACLDLDIEIREITFNATRIGGQSMFLWVKILLKSPKSPKNLSVEYSASVVSHSIATQFDLVNDLESWTFRERDRIGDYSSHGPYLPAHPLPSLLEAGVYAEGWLHFVSNEVTDIEIGRSAVRLRLETPLGKVEEERQGITIVGTHYTMRRRPNL